MIAESIIKARNEAGLTQAELAARTGLKQPNISRLEKGERNPDLDTLNKVAEALGYSLKEFFNKYA